MPLSQACDLGQHADCGGNGDMFGCTCPCHEPDECCSDCGAYSAECVCWYADEQESEPADGCCELCGRPGSDAHPVGLVADPTSSDGRLTVCETCNREEG